MKALTQHKKITGLFFLIAFMIMLSMAFFQCYKTTHDLLWAADPDFDRDIAFVRGTLDGHFGKDPNYKGEYLWYNPLLFSVETVIVKMTSLQPNVVAVRAGAYLNLLGPVAFSQWLYRFLVMRSRWHHCFLFYSLLRAICWAGALPPILHGFTLCVSPNLFFTSILFYAIKHFQHKNIFGSFYSGLPSAFVFLGTRHLRSS